MFTMVDIHNGIGRLNSENGSFIEFFQCAKTFWKFWDPLKVYNYNHTVGWKCIKIKKVSPPKNKYFFSIVMTTVDTSFFFPWIIWLLSLVFILWIQIFGFIFWVSFFGFHLNIDDTRLRAFKIKFSRFAFENASLGFVFGGLWWCRWWRVIFGDVGWLSSDSHHLDVLVMGKSWGLGGFHRVVMTVASTENSGIAVVCILLLSV